MESFDYKFRFWNHHHRRMEYFDFMKMPSPRLLMAYDTEIMQRVPGVRDINKQDLYEGDVVSVDRQDSFSTFNTGVIRLVSGMFIIDTERESTVIEKRLKPSNHVYMGLHEWPGLTLLGNRYEFMNWRF